MQLKAERAQPPDDRWDDPAATERVMVSEATREYEARRCHVCQCRYPPFGFGPPLIQTGHTLWACMTHRDEMDRLLNGTTPQPVEQKQQSLFDLKSD
jgi:hypothetical protein